MVEVYFDTHTHTYTYTHIIRNPKSVYVSNIGIFIQALRFSVYFTFYLLFIDWIICVDNPKFRVKLTAPVLVIREIY